MSFSESEAGTSLYDITLFLKYIPSSADLATWHGRDPHAVLNECGLFSKNSIAEQLYNTKLEIALYLI